MMQVITNEEIIVDIFEDMCLFGVEGIIIIICNYLKVSVVVSVTDYIRNNVMM